MNATLPRGNTIARCALALARSRGSAADAAHFAEISFGPTSEPARILRSAAQAGSLDPDSWGAELGSWRQNSAELIATVDETSIIGRMRGALQSVPLGTRSAVETDRPHGSWVGAATDIEVSDQAFDSLTLRPLKAAGIVVVTRELAELSNPQAERVVSRALRSAIIEVTDRTFIDPDAAAEAGVSPASVLADAETTASSGDPSADVRWLVEAFAGDLESAFWVTHPSVAAGMAMARDAGGSYPFPDVGVRGGSVLGIPLVTSRHVPTDTDGASILALIDGGGIAAGDDGLELSASKETSLTVGDQQVNLWQQSMAAVMVLRRMNWKLLRPAGAVYVSGASYGGS